MFETTTGELNKRRRSPAGVIVSFVLHGVVALVLIAWGAREIIVEDEEITELVFMSAPPPPPPPPPPGGSSKPKKPKVEKPPETPQEIVQPVEVPDEIPEEQPVESEAPPIEGGQEGGVEGGVVGGQVGGVVGGQIGGVLGGEIGSLGSGETVGQIKWKAQPRYPDMARESGLQGDVDVKILVDIDGKVAKAKSEHCKEWAAASKEDRRKRWHPSLCIYAVSGPDELYYESIMAAGDSKYLPWKSGNVFTRFWGTITYKFKLQ